MDPGASHPLATPSLPRKLYLQLRRPLSNRPEFPSGVASATASRTSRFVPPTRRKSRPAKVKLGNR